MLLVLEFSPDKTMSASPSISPLVQVKPSSTTTYPIWTLEQIAALFELPFHEL